MSCRVPDSADTDPNPQRRTRGNTRALPLRLERNERGILLSLPLLEDHPGVLTAHLLFSGWCVVLLDRPEDVARLAVSETFHEDGEIPRTYGELIRTVELTTPEGRLRLVRDPLADSVTRWTDGHEFRFGKADLRQHQGPDNLIGPHENSRSVDNEFVVLSSSSSSSSLLMGGERRCRRVRMPIDDEDDDEDEQGRGPQERFPQIRNSDGRQ